MRVTLKTPEVLARLQKKLKVGTSTKRERLVAILGRLGSDQDGEVLTAARMATRLIDEMRLTWDYVIRQEGDGGAVINQSTIESSFLRTQLDLAEIMLVSAQRERSRLEAEVREMRRRAVEAEKRAEMLRSALMQQMTGDRSGQGVPKVADTAISREEARQGEREGFFSDDPYVVKPESFYTSTTDAAPEPQTWEEMKSRWTDNPAYKEAPTEKKRHIYSFADQKVKDMLWTAEAPQAAEYCLKSKVLWNYEQTLFLQARAKDLLISAEELAKLRVMFASARNANNQHKGGATTA
jgi:hypothetical protein